MKSFLIKAVLVLLASCLLQLSLFSGNLEDVKTDSYTATTDTKDLSSTLGLASTSLWLEDFDGSNTTNPLLLSCDSEGDDRDYFGVVCNNSDNTGITCPYEIDERYNYYSSASVLETSEFLGARHATSTPCGTSAQVRWSGIDITDCDSPDGAYICFEVAESRAQFVGDGGDELSGGDESNWTGATNMQFTVSVDGCPFESVTAFEEISATDRPGVDTDCSGSGDTGQVSDIFTQYCFQLPQQGCELDINISFNEFTADGKDLAIDDIEVLCAPTTDCLPVTPIVSCTTPHGTIGACNLWKDDFDGSNTTNPISIPPGCTNGVALPDDRDYIGIVCLNEDLTDDIPVCAAMIDERYSYFASNPFTGSTELVKTSFLGARDFDGECGTSTGGGVGLTYGYTGIDISDCRAPDQLYLCVDLAESMPMFNGDAGDELSSGAESTWNDDASVEFSVNVDGCGFETLTAIEEISAVDQPGIDTDCNGRGDVGEITDVFTTYCFLLPQKGNLLDLNIFLTDLDADGIDIAIDNIEIKCVAPALTCMPTTPTASCSDPDTEAPTAMCPPADVTVMIDPISGEGTLAANALAGGQSFDNPCNSAVVTETSPEVTYDADDVGTQTVTLTATDACGNTSTVDCSVQVESTAFTFLDENGNGDSFGIADPCSCNNDQSANGAGDGTFSETVQVFGPSGFELVVGAGSTADDMIGVDLGDPIPEIGTTGVYEIEFDHVDQVGYTLSVSAIIGGVETSLNLEISNACQYPVITEPNLDADVFCFNGDPMPFDGNEVTEQSGLPGSVSVHLNSPTGPAITFFDPSAYGEGTYTLYFVFEADAENDNVNTDPDPNPANPGCSTFTTTQVTIGDGGPAICNDSVNFSVDALCGVSADADFFLEGSDDALYTITVEDADGVVIDLDNVSDYLGQTLTYMATNDCNGAVCWGTVSFEDKLGPDPFTCSDVTISCIEYANDEIPTEPILFDADANLVTDINALDNCGEVTMTFEDTITSDGICGETIINRTYIATDAHGNTTTCTSAISVEPISLIDDLGTVILLPPDLVEVPCGTDLDPYSIAAVFDNANTDDCPESDNCPIDIIENNEGIAMAFPHYVAWGCNASCTDKNTEHMQPIDNGVCSIMATYSDASIDICGQNCPASVKVLRTWTLLDWCTSEQIPFVQIIESIDNDGPEIVVSDQTYSADPWGCVASGDLPEPSTLTDDCGGDNLTYTVEGPDDITIISVNGDGNAPYAFIGASKGEHTFTYYSEDCCGNMGSATMTISVIDDSPPSAISKQDIVLTLPATGVAKMFAESADNGSHDGDCGPVRLEISKIGGSTCDANTSEVDVDTPSASREGDCDLGGPILEGDFELGDANNDPDGDSRDPWRNSDLGGVIQITSSAFTGNWAAKFPDDGSRIGYQEIILTPNTDYTINFFYFLDDPNIGTLNIDVLGGGGYGDSQPVSSGAVLGSFSNGTTTNYSPGSISFNSGGNTIVSIYIHNEGVEAQIDDIELNCGGALAACTQGGPVLEGGFDLGDANNDPDGDSRDPWRNSDLGGVVQITSSALVGDWAAKLPDDGSRIGYQELSVSANTDFTLDFFYFLDDADVGTVTVDVLAGGGYGSSLPISSGTVLGSFTDGSATTYTDASISFNSGANTTVAIYFYNEGVEAQLDEISLNCDDSSGTDTGDDEEDTTDTDTGDDDNDDDNTDDDTGTGPQPQSDAAEYVTFCCDDIDGTSFYTTSNGQVIFYNEYDVVLGVWDDGNCDGIIGNDGDNYSETFATVRVEDKQPPVLICPADATVGCTDDLLIHDSASAATVEELAILQDANIGTGIATAFGTCGDLTVTYVDNVQEDVCFEDYEIRRQWCVTGSSICCEQIISVEIESPFDPSTISWNTGFPEAEITLSCIDDDPMQSPTWSETVCDMIAWSVETDTFYVDPAESELACIKVIKNYTVIDWCTELEYTFTQVIKVIDTNAPEITVESTVVSTDVNCQPDGMICATATDMGDCESPMLNWEVLIDLESNSIYDLAYGSNLDDSDDFYLSPTSPGEELCLSLPENLLASKAQHSVLWKVTDGCGNSTTVSSSFQLLDTIAPVPYCINVSTALAGPNGTEVWACDFIAYVEDNCSTEFRYTFRGPEEGFDTPESTPGWISDRLCEGDLFFCPSQGGGDTRTVKVYTWDECNNFEVCFVDLTLSGCTGFDNANPRIAGIVGTEFNEMVEDVFIQINSAQPEYPMSVFTDSNGAYASHNNASLQDYAISAYKNDDHRNGVSTLDILMIQRHILNIAPLTSPYQYISADANDDQVISAADLVDIRKLVLEIIDEFPSNQSWRFVDAAQALTTNNAFAFSEVIDILALNADMDHEDFIANKIGDVNGSVEVNASSSISEVRNGKTLNMTFTPELSSKGVRVDVTSKNFEDILGYQFTLNTNGQQLVGIESGALQINESNVGVLDDETLTMSWTSVEAVTVSDEVLFSLYFSGSDISALDDVEINSEATSAEAYDTDLSIMEVAKTGTPSSKFQLKQNQPNPFEQQTVIEFILPEAGDAQLTIMDVTGKIIAQIHHTYPKGINRVTLDKANLGTSGIFYYQLESEGLSATKKMIILD